MAFLERDGREAPTQRGLETGVAIAFGLVGAIVVIGSLQVGVGWGAEGPKSGFFPFYVGLAIIVSSLINLIGARGIARARIFATWPELSQVWSVGWPTTVYVLLIPYLGVYLASVILIAFFMARLGGYRPHVALMVAIPVMIALYLVFETWFLVPLPKGPIEELIGL
ncbi:MAG: tripartite tricarboxylate transporter TctB family protein [Elsteraceae bacterium]